MKRRAEDDGADDPDNFVFDLEGYPPAGVLWVTGALDTFCSLPLLRWCEPWRNALMTEVSVPRTASKNAIRSTVERRPLHPWLDEKFRLPALSSILPPVMSFDDYSSTQTQDQQQLRSPLSSYYSYAFETPSTALSVLTTPEAGGMVILLVLLLRAIKKVLMPTFREWGRIAGTRTNGKSWATAPDNAARLTKFSEYVFRLVYHTLISVYGWYFFYLRDPWWAGQTKLLYAGFPKHEVQPAMTWYYLIQSAYNVDAMLSLLELSFVVVKANQKETAATTKQPFRSILATLFPYRIAWSPTVRGDFNEMFVHHLITNALIFGSSHCRLTRVGSMVFLVHDVSDVPVDVSKLANFLKQAKTTMFCFAIMVIVWVNTRLYTLPITIFGNILTESHLVLLTDPDKTVLLYLACRYFFYALVAALILLHAFWFTMFLRIAHTMLSKNEVHDYTEHKKGESETAN